MHISCAICAELFSNADVDNISVTPCGHIFHGPCLMQWLQRSKTCPQCRYKTTQSSIIRTFFNVASANDTSTAEGSVEQQSQIDNLKFQMLEKSADLRKKNDEIEKLGTEIAKLKKTQRLSRETILGLEQKIQTNAILSETHLAQLKHMKERVKVIFALEEELKATKEQMNLMDNMKQILAGSQKEAEVFLNEHMSSKTLAVSAVALKRELKISEEKRHALRLSQRQLNDQIQRLLAEKAKLEEENAVFESRLYKFESAEKENHHASTDSIVLSPMPGVSCAAPVAVTTSPATPTPIAKPTGDTRATKFIKLTKGEAHSPFVKSSSIAGLAPLMKRPASLALQMKSAANAGREFSIFKKPRLANFKPSSLK